MSLLDLRRIGVPGALLPTLLLGVGPFPVIGLAADVPEALQHWVRTDPDQKAVDSLDFILSLSLTEDQARAIMPLYEQACRLHLDHYREQAETQPLEVEACTVFLAQDRLNQGFTPDVERHTAQIHHRAQVARDELTKGLNELADGVWRILTLDQRHIAEHYEPTREAVFASFGKPHERRRAARHAARRAQRRRAHADAADPDFAEAHEELAAINKAIHARPDAIAEFLLTPAAAAPLYEATGTPMSEVVKKAVDSRRFGTGDYPLARWEQDRKALRALRKEINNWNLANGMHFDRWQIEQLVTLADEAERLKTTRRRARPGDKMSPDVLSTRFVRLELAAESVLRPGQLEVLRTFQACLIPPKNLKDPVRVGQANDTTHLAKWLDRARRSPDGRRERMIERLIDREATHLGPRDEAAMDERRELLRETVSRAAEMSDVDFALAKDELTETVTPANRRNELIADIDAMRRERLEPGRTYRLLLNPGFAAVLKARYEQLSGGSPFADEE